MANIATSNQTTKLFAVEVLLDPPARPGHPYALPSVLIIGIVHKHNHLTHTGTEYTYEIIRLQAQGLPNGRNFLNELKQPLLNHFDALFFSAQFEESHIQSTREQFRQLVDRNTVTPLVYNSLLEQQPSRGHAKDYRDHYGEYLRSEDYQYDRGEERREKESDPSNNL